MKQSIVGLYDRMNDAQDAIRALHDAGFKNSDISLLVDIRPLTIPAIGPAIAAGPLGGSAPGGLVATLVKYGVPDTEAQFYVEGVRRGGALVAVNVEDNKTSQARQILQSHHWVNFQERVQEWRQSGWTGYDPNAKPFTNEQITHEQGMHTYNR